MRMVAALAAIMAVSMLPAIAQSQVVANPHAVSFTPSPDENRMSASGVKYCDHYDLHANSPGQPEVKIIIGKPTPDANGVDTFMFPPGFSDLFTPNVEYSATVFMVASDGTHVESAPSNQFEFLGPVKNLKVAP